MGQPKDQSMYECVQSWALQMDSNLDSGYVQSYSLWTHSEDSNAKAITGSQVLTVSLATSPVDRPHQNIWKSVWSLAKLTTYAVSATLVWDRWNMFVLVWVILTQHIRESLPVWPGPFPNFMGGAQEQNYLGTSKLWILIQSISGAKEISTWVMSKFAIKGLVVNSYTVN